MRVQVPPSAQVRLVALEKTIRFFRISWVILCVTIIIGILFSFFLPIKSLLNFYVDDGFFYLEIAKNFASGFGSTFDRVSLTNGYHPLWFIILSLIFFITSLFAKNPDPNLLLRVSTLTHFTLICLSYYFVYKFLKLVRLKQIFNRVMLVVAVTLTPIVFRNYGLEIHVVIFLLSVFVWVKGREIIKKENLRWYIIILYALLGLARLDYFFSFIPVIILLDSYDKDIKLFLKNVLMYSVPVFTALIIYLSINYYYFGHLFSIAGTIKNTFPYFNTDNFKRIVALFDKDSFFNNIQLLVFVLTTVLLFLKRKDENIEIIKLLLKINFGLFVFLFLNFLFNIELYREWYFGGPFFLSAVAIAVLLKNRVWIINSMVAVLIVLSFFYLYSARITSNKYSTVYEYCQDLRKVVNDNERVLQIDYSGIVGFLSDRKIVNGDGLVNSFEYYEYYKNNRLFDYIKKYHIDYYSTFTAKIDSSSNTVCDDIITAWGNYNFVFPTNKIVLRKLQIFDSYQFRSTHEWYLISLN